MQLKIGDLVVHPIYGVGDIVKIEEKQFSEIEACLYYQIAFSGSTLWIPVKAQADVGLRLVIAKSDLDQYRGVLKTTPDPLNKGKPQRRHLELAERLKPGSFRVMCEVVRDLTALSRKKSLGVTAKTMLRRTRERLQQEWAVAANLSVAEATQEIDTLLQVTQEKA